MLAMLCVALTMWMGGQTAPAKGVTLPDTPQGKHLQAWIKAFNSGDEKTFQAAEEEHMAPEALGRTPAAQRSAMFKRMKGNFGTFKVERVVKNTAEEIVIEVPTQDGARGTFTFKFEAQTPFRINGIGVNIDG